MTNYDLLAFAQWNICIERSRYGYDAPHGNFSRPRRWTLRQLRQIYDEAFVGARMFMRVCGKMPANAEILRGAANAAGRAEVLTTPREFPALTPRVTERL